MASLPPVNSNKDEAKSLKDAAPLNKTTAPIPVPLQKGPTRIAFVYTSLYQISKVDEANISEIVKTFSGLIVKRISQNIEVACLPYHQLDGHKDSYDLVVFVTISRTQQVQDNHLAINANRVLELLKRVKGFTKDFPESHCFLVQVMEIKNPMSKPTLCFEGERTISWFPEYDKFKVLTSSKKGEDRFLGVPHNQHSLDDFATKLSEALLAPVEKKHAVEAIMKAKTTAAPAAAPANTITIAAPAPIPANVSALAPPMSAVSNLSAEHKQRLDSVPDNVHSLPKVLFVWSTLYQHHEYARPIINRTVKTFGNSIAQKIKQKIRVFNVPFDIFVTLRESYDIVVFVTISDSMATSTYSARQVLELFNRCKRAVKSSSEKNTFLVQIRRVVFTTRHIIDFIDEDRLPEFPKYDTFQAVEYRKPDPKFDTSTSFDDKVLFFEAADPNQPTNLEAFATKLDKALLATRIDTKLDTEAKRVDEERAALAARTTPKAVPTPGEAAAPASPSLLSGIQEINQTDLKISYEQLGQGGFGSVHKGTWKGTPVAIKRSYRIKEGYDPTKQLQNEMQIMWRLNSSNTAQHTVQMMGYCMNPYCLIMEVMPQTLKQWLQAKPRDLNIKIRIAFGMAKGLVFMHNEGIAHGDIKPSNIYIDDRKLAKDSIDGTLIVKYGDFGHSIDPSRSKDSQEAGQTKVIKQSHTNFKMGTPNYAAPERWSFGSTTTKESDVYSFGAVLWELVSGKPPHEDRDEMQIIFRYGKHIQDPIPANWPSKLATAIEACRAWEPKSRPTADALESYFASDAEAKYDSDANDFSKFLPRFIAFKNQKLQADVQAQAGPARTDSSAIVTALVPHAGPNPSPLTSQFK